MDETRQPENDATSYSVGYRQPPNQTRFKKGQSGNPKGRPKGSLNLSTLIEKEMNQRVTINENGARKSVTKKHAVAKQLVNKAAGGDVKVIPLLLNEERQREGNPNLPPAAASGLPKEDQRVMASLIERIRNSEANPATSSLPPSEEPSATSDEAVDRSLADKEPP